MTDSKRNLLVLHIPERPKDAEFLKKETARVHAGAVFWYLEDRGITARQQLKILEKMKEYIKSQ